MEAIDHNFTCSPRGIDVRGHYARCFRIYLLDDTNNYLVYPITRQLCDYKYCFVNFSILQSYVHGSTRRSGVYTTQRANVRTMYVHCTYKPVHTDLVRITFGMKVFWTYGSVRTMYVHSRTYNVRTLYVQSNTKTELK